MLFVGSPVLRSWTFRGMEISSRSQTFQNSWSIFTIWLGRLKVLLFIRCNIIKEWPLASEFSEFEYSPEIHHFWQIWVLAKMAFSGNVSGSPDSPTFAKPCCTDSPADPFSESDFHFSFLLFFFCSRLFRVRNLLSLQNLFLNFPFQVWGWTRTTWTRSRSTSSRPSTDLLNPSTWRSTPSPRSGQGTSRSCCTSRRSSLTSAGLRGLQR